MSVIFGIYRSNGIELHERELTDLAVSTEKYASEGTRILVRGPVGMGFQPYRTHDRSTLEAEVATDQCGNMLVLDGRIDNWRELQSQLNLRDNNSCDSAIILSSFSAWGEHCFSRLIGDWAVALWCASERRLYLARDHAGTRTLYCETHGDSVQWSTYLETFATHREEHRLDEGYTAAFLSSGVIGAKTPYKGIGAVLPGHYTVYGMQGLLYTTAHWTCLTTKTIHYSADIEYENHFTALFQQAVSRRTGPGAPIIAHLSGGMDSTSIVCMSDHIRKSESREHELLDTLSYYDDTEPNWDERPFFSIVEARRRKVGIHIETSPLERTFEMPDPHVGRYLLPVADSVTFWQESRLHGYLEPHNYRVILSGTGGDETLGGVPTPLPELADHLATGRVDRLVARAIAWSLARRQPLITTLFETIAFTASLYCPGRNDKSTIPPWLSRQLQERVNDTGRMIEGSTNRIGIRPSALSNARAWWFMLDSLPHLYPPLLERREYRYPYLDRDLVEFLFAIPREQIVAPGRRRYLMRRALRDIVPPEILERRRKAFQLRGIVTLLTQSKAVIHNLFRESIAADMGFIEPNVLESSLELISAGGDSRWSSCLIRTIGFELWLKRSLHGSFKENLEGEAYLHPSAVLGR